MQHLLTVIKSELVEHAYQDPLMHKFIKSLPEDYKILFKGDGCVYSNLAHVMKNGPSQGQGASFTILESDHFQGHNIDFQEHASNLDLTFFSSNLSACAMIIPDQLETITWFMKVSYASSEESARGYAKKDSIEESIKAYENLRDTKFEKAVNETLANDDKFRKSFAKYHSFAEYYELRPTNVVAALKVPDQNFMLNYYTSPTFRGKLNKSWSLDK
jgi:hypothetical protein